MKKIALLLVLASLASLTACGVKNDLVRPDGKPTPRGERDPSLPPTATNSKP
jgi:predicted small lipoprotein YifL